jgi:tetratricopeptide (TPR) repeat protein
MSTSPRLSLAPLLATLVCSLLVASLTFAAEGTSPAREQLAAATYQFRTKRFKRAVKLGRKALEVAETPAERQDALNLIAIALRGQADGDPELLAEAEAALRESLALSEDRNLTTAYNLVIVLKESGKAEDALELAREIYRTREGTKLADEARIQACQAKRELTEEGSPSVPDVDPLDVRSGVEAPEALYDPWPTASQKVSFTAYGQVTVELTIDAEGCVRDAELLGGDLPETIARDVVDTFNSWVFRSPRLDGNPVSARVQFGYAQTPGWKAPEGVKNKPILPP